MRVAQIENLEGSYGGIAHAYIWETVKAFALDGIALDMRFATMSDLDFIRTIGNCRPHLVVDPSWWNDEKLASLTEEKRKIALDQVRRFGLARLGAEGLTDTGVALYASKRLTELHYDNLPCSVIFDNERQGSDHILAMLRKWRELRATRDTIWAPESMQGGWMTDELVLLINADGHLRIARQNYHGDMYPVDADQSRLDLRARGIWDSRITAYYGACSDTNPYRPLPLPVGWSGIAFTLEYLDRNRQAA